MPQVANCKSHPQKMPEDRIPSGTSKSSDELSQAVLRSIQGLHLGTGAASKLLYRAAIRIGYYYDSPGGPFSVLNFGEIVREDLLPTLNEIYNLLTWPDGWNGYNAYAPKYDAVQYASQWIVMFYLDVMALGMDWIRPNVTASGDGEVVFEWRQGIKKLTIYIGNQSAEYVEDWGPDMITEMEDGYANSSSMRRSLWKWLMS